MTKFCCQGEKTPFSCHKVYLHITVAYRDNQITLINKPVTMKTTCTSNDGKAMQITILEPTASLTADDVTCSFKQTTRKPSCNTRRRTKGRCRLAESVHSIRMLTIGRGPLSTVSNIDSRAVGSVDSALAVITFSLRPLLPLTLPPPSKHKHKCFQLFSFC